MRYLRVGPPKWPKEFLAVDFYNDYPTDRESGPGPKSKKWINDSKKWIMAFLVDIMGCKLEDINWRKGYFEWYMHAKIGNQWWYFSTGDIRFKTMDSLLVRTAESSKDYTGGRNQYVRYGSDHFADELEHILKPKMVIGGEHG